MRQGPLAKVALKPVTKIMDNVIYVDFKTKKRISPQALEVTNDIPPKASFSDRRTVFLELMQSGMVRTVVDSNVAGVVLPDMYAGQIVNLNWSYKLSIPDLSIDDGGIKGTLSFQQEPFHVNIPWESIIAVWNLNNPIESKIEWTPTA